MADASPPPPPAAFSPGRRAAVAVLTVIALAALATFLYQNRGYIGAHYAVSPGAATAIAALMVATLALRGLSHRAMFHRLGIRATVFDWFRLVTVTSFTNYLPLSAGMLAKAFFLKRVHALPYGSFAVGQVALLVIIASTNGAAGLATLAFAFPEHVPGVIGAGFALMISASALLFLPIGPMKRLLHERVAWDAAIVSDLRRAWPMVCVLQLGILLASAAILRICFALGSSGVGFSACLIFSAAAMLTRLVAFVPGAIGIREFMVGGLAYLTGFELRDAVIAAAAARTVEIAVVFTLGGLFTYRLSGEVLSSYGDAKSG
ncbi:MAG: lysylphosphatidylglycerol synthase domain-containing protein [Myxococcota bacterium]